jgi:hypothetical protein
MPDSLSWVVVGAAVVGLFAGLYVLLIQRQATDPTTRGENSSQPPGGGY